VDESLWSQLPERATEAYEEELLPLRMPLAPYGTLLLHHAPALPRIAFELSFEIGTMDAEPGVAELYANLFVTPQSDDGEFSASKYFRGIGTSLSMSCRMEDCSIKGSCLTIGFDATMTVVGRLLSREAYTGNFRFRRDLLETRWRFRSARDLALDAALQRSLPAGHPYARALVTTPEQMRAVTEEQLFRFQDALRRSRRTLAFAGALAPEAAKRAGTVLLSTLGAESRERPRPGHIAAPLASLRIIHRAEATSAWVAAAFLGPGASTPEGNAWRTVLPLLGRRVTAQTRRAHGDSYAAPVDLLPWRGAQITWFEAETVTERAGETVQSLLKALGDVRQEAGASFNWAVADHRRSRLGAAQTSTGRVELGMELELAQTRGNPVTVEAVVEVVERYLRPEHVVFVVHGNADTIKASLAAAGVDLPITVER